MANEQRAARGKHDHRRLLLQRVMESVGCHLEPRGVALEGGGVVRIDGIDRDESILVEVFADRGQLKGPQRRRLSQHALKLITLGRTRPAARLIVAVADADVARAARQDGWLAPALASWGVEVLLVEREPAPAAVAAEPAPDPEPDAAVLAAEPAPDPEPEPEAEPAPAVMAPQPEATTEPAPMPNPSTDPDPADQPDSPKRRRLIRLWSKNPGDFR
jgi:hypothetical protein